MYGWYVNETLNLTMDEVNIIVEAANKRTKLMNPELDKNGKPKPPAKKKSMDEFLKERNV